MTVIEEIENLSRDLQRLKRSDEQSQENEEVVRKFSSLARNVRSLTGTAESLYEAASLLTPQFESTELAASVWEDLHKNFTFVLGVLERLPNLGSDIDTPTEEVRIILRNIVDKVAKAFLEFDAKAEVDRCDAIAREGFAMMDAEEAKLEH
jgi:hypothetical protein